MLAPHKWIDEREPTLVVRPEKVDRARELVAQIAARHSGETRLAFPVGWDERDALI